jgi:hypothetical protein
VSPLEWGAEKRTRAFAAGERPFPHKNKNLTKYLKQLANTPPYQTSRISSQAPFLGHMRAFQKGGLNETGYEI